MNKKIYILSRVHTIMVEDNTYADSDYEAVFVHVPLLASTDINQLIKLGNEILERDFKPEDINGKIDVASIRGVSDLSSYPKYIEEYHLNSFDISGMTIDVVDMI